MDWDVATPPSSQVLVHHTLPPVSTVILLSCVCRVFLVLAWASLLCASSPWAVRFPSVLVLPNLPVCSRDGLLAFFAIAAPLGETTDPEIVVDASFVGSEGSEGAARECTLYVFRRALADVEQR